MTFYNSRRPVRGPEGPRLNRPSSPFQRTGRGVAGKCTRKCNRAWAHFKITNPLLFRVMTQQHEWGPPPCRRVSLPVSTTTGARSRARKSAISQSVNASLSERTAFVMDSDVDDPLSVQSSPPPTTTTSAIMPRPAQPARASSASHRAGSRVTSGSLANSPFKSPIK